MFQVRKEFTWDASHRLVGHKGKCASVHGHTYRAIVTVQASTLDELGVGIDFGDFSPLGEWIQENWDHAMLLNSSDMMVPMLSIPHEGKKASKTYLFSSNPTAEVMAQILFEEAERLLPNLRHGLQVKSVEIFETPKSSVLYSVR